MILIWKKVKIISIAVQYKNKVKCKLCGDIIESKNTHDFQKCKCGAIFVDGGLSYRRMGFPADMQPEDVIEYIWEPLD